MMDFIEEAIRSKIKNVSPKDIQEQTQKGYRMLWLYDYQVKYTDATPHELFNNVHDKRCALLASRVTQAAEDLFTYGFCIKVLRIPSPPSIDYHLLFRFVLDWDLPCCPSNFVDYVIRNPDNECKDSQKYWQKVCAKWDNITGFSRN